MRPAQRLRDQHLLPRRAAEGEGDGRGAAAVAGQGRHQARRSSRYPTGDYFKLYAGKPRLREGEQPRPDASTAGVRTGPTASASSRRSSTAGSSGRPAATPTSASTIPEVDTLLDKARPSTDAAKREAIWAADRQEGHGRRRHRARASRPRACSTGRQEPDERLRQPTALRHVRLPRARRQAVARHVTAPKVGEGDGGRPRLTAAAGHRGRRIVVTYIIRRLIAAVVLLLVVSMVTFAIFFLVPRLAGATADDLAVALRRQDRRPRRRSTRSAEQLGLHRPVWVQYGRFVKGIVVGADYNTGPDDGALPGALPRLLVHQPEPGAARPARPAPGHALARRRRRGPLAGRRGRASACSRRCDAAASFDRAAMGVALAGVSLPIFFTGLLSLAIFSYELGWTAPGRQLHPVHREPAAVGLRPAPAVDHAGVPATPRRTPGSPGRACSRR